MKFFLFLFAKTKVKALVCEKKMVLVFIVPLMTRDKKINISETTNRDFWIVPKGNPKTLFFVIGIKTLLGYFLVFIFLLIFLYFRRRMFIFIFILKK